MERKNFSRLNTIIDMPDLLSVQKESYDKLLQASVEHEKRERIGLQKIFDDTFPIEDVHGRFILDFVRYEIEEPLYSFEESKYKGITYAAPLKITLKLIFKNIDEETDEPLDSIKDIIEQDVYLCNVPLMGDNKAFLINGVERVIINQIHRSPGVFFTETTSSSGKQKYIAQLLPNKGAWLEFNVDHNNVMHANLDRRRNFAATILLRAFGHDTNEKIFDLFFDRETVKFSQKDAKNKNNPLIKKMLASDIIDKETGEIIYEAGTKVNNAMLDHLLSFEINEIELVKADDEETDIIFKTLKKDNTDSYEEAIERIYTLVRGTTPATTEIAEKFFENVYFNVKRYEIGKVGRFKLNKRLGHNVDENEEGLVPEDIIETLRKLMHLSLDNSEDDFDDIDHLGNRRLRRVGELLENTLNHALSKMVKSIKERMMLKDISSLTPKDLINARLISSMIMSFFSTSQLSQFMEQTNPLAELTHKRRMSALGPGGLTRETAGFEVRDVHHSHYGRICPIETPEGPNIGLITSLSTYARINEYGFIESPYRKAEKGKVTDSIEYLTADEEDKYTIAQANARIDDKGKFLDKYVLCRRKGEYPMVPKNEVDYMDVSPAQLVSPSASLIPFLEHDDANRALMGSNMQRQAVPLLRPTAPVVGTGMEEKAARDTGSVVLAENDGTVEEVTGDYIKVKAPGKHSENIFEEDAGYDLYHLKSFERTNQDTTVIQKPIVSVGDKIKAGDIIADGHACDNGELALGQNMLVALMPWRGYNFEDAIVISERVLHEDTLTSIHINEQEVDLRETELGPEEFTRELPNVPEEALADLDENGIIRIGAKVKPGDILVGKVTPKGEVELTPEEKLLKAIFGEKASDVRDTSLRVPPGTTGVVLDVRVLSKESTRKENVEKEIVKQIEEKVKHIEKKRLDMLVDILKGKKAKDSVYDIYSRVVVRKNTRFNREVLEKVDYNTVLIEKSAFGDDYDKVKSIVRDSNKAVSKIRGKIGEVSMSQVHGDELPNGVLKKVKVFIAQKRNVQVGDKLSGRHGNKGVISTVVPVEDMPYMEDGTPVDIVLNPLGVPSRMNVGQVLETLLAFAGIKLGMKYATPVFDGCTIDNIKEYLEEAGLNPNGKTPLYDGMTGEKFDEDVTVGYMYIMKLSHMIEDKIHARATGPYSLISQQPLGGKAQFGGQRFGEMEVWALMAYGAAHTLQEILTVKSDDVRGRSDLYESIIKGKNPPDPGLPAAFNVLIKELNGLCLDVELGSEEEENNDSTGGK
ncbi:MAG: DNA-directed RNA polymerase subunit beta [bacterium]